MIRGTEAADGSSPGDSEAPASIYSMTGQGRAELQSDLGTVVVEIRGVNNRGYKLSARLADPLVGFQSRVDGLVRGRVKRGSIQLRVEFTERSGCDRPRLNSAAIRGYCDQLLEIQREVEGTAPIDLVGLVSLPGVLESGRVDRSGDAKLQAILEDAVTEALDRFNAMRRVEGGRMAESLLGDCRSINGLVGEIDSMSPRIVGAYRQRLESKIRRAMEERGIEHSPVDLLREVQVFADRSDISEEVTRLRSHLMMFRSAVQGEQAGSSADPIGRKLDFITQEMFRETNTIGSKSLDADVSARVVEVKCAIERMREIVQNLE